MTVSYRGDLYDLLRYNPRTRKLHIRLYGVANAPIRRVGITRRVNGLTEEVRAIYGMPSQIIGRRLLLRVNQGIPAPASFFASDPIVDTEL